MQNSNACPFFVTLARVSQGVFAPEAVRNATMYCVGGRGGVFLSSSSGPWPAAVQRLRAAALKSRLRSDRSDSSLLLKRPDVGAFSSEHSKDRPRLVS